MPGPSASPARQPSLRSHNLALVLAAVADGGPASRARLAAATGLTKATVSTLVDTLTGARLLEERGLDAGTVGRPGQTLGLSGRGPVGIGLEINVDYVATCTVDLAGAVVGREALVQDLRGLPVETVLARAAGALGRAVEGARAGARPVAGIAVAMPGLVEVREELLRDAPNLGWRDVPVLAGLRSRLAATAPTSLPAMTLGNEADVAALGELWCGGHRACDGTPLDTFVYVSGEIGVGAGIVRGGQLLGGQLLDGGGAAGEIGHLQVADAPACGCGGHGCLERLAGQEAILRAAGLDPGPGAGVGTAIGRPDGPLGELLARARAGRPEAVAAITAAGGVLGSGIAAVVNLVGVHTVVLGGIYAPLATWLREPVEQALAARVLSARWAPVRVLVGTLGPEAAVRGAAVGAVRAVIADPAGYLAALADAH